MRYSTLLRPLTTVFVAGLIAQPAAAQRRGPSAFAARSTGQARDVRPTEHANRERTSFLTPLATRPGDPSRISAERVPGLVGALIGGAVGAAVVAIYAKGACDSPRCDDTARGARDGAIWGAAIGATIDVLAWLDARREKRKGS